MRFVWDPFKAAFNAKKHRVTFEDGALPTPERQSQRFGQRTGHQDRFDVGDFHGCTFPNHTVVNPIVSPQLLESSFGRGSSEAFICCVFLDSVRLVQERCENAVTR